MEGSMQRFSHAVKVAGPAYPAGSRRRLRHANRRWNGSECGFGFLRVVGVIREGPSHDEQTPLIHGHLRVVILLKSGIRRVFHDARLRVGKIVLVALFTQAEQLLDLSSQLRLQLQESLVTDCVVLGGIGMDLGPIQADRSQFQHARLLCEQEHAAPNRSFSSSRNVRRNVASVSWSGCWLPAMKRKGTAS